MTYRILNEGCNMQCISWFKMKKKRARASQGFLGSHTPRGKQLQL